MAWNEPGGGKDNDPWGGGNQGPPDLDEALRQFQRKIQGLFGGGGSGGGNSSGAGFGLGSLGALLLILALIWAAFGFYQVDQKERAVVLRLGAYHSTVGPGLHWNPPLIDIVETVNVTEVDHLDSRGSMLTEDENIVDVALAVQYVRANPEHYLLRVVNPEVSLEEALESSLRHAVGSSKMNEVITEGREKIAVEVQQRLQSYMDAYETGIRIVKVNIKDAQAPAQVQDAFDDVTRAKEDKERLKNEADAYANQVIPEARGAAQRELEEANAYRDRVVARAEGEADRFVKVLTEYKKAPEVTRQRLYLDAIQDVYSRTGKVLVDVKGGNNMMYLPLDKLSQGSRNSTVGGRGDFSDAELTDLANKVLEQIRRENPSRRREGR